MSDEAMCVAMRGSAAELFDVILCGAARLHSVRRQACAAAQSVSRARGVSLCCPHFRGLPARRPNVFSLRIGPRRREAAVPRSTFAEKLPPSHVPPSSSIPFLLAGGASKARRSEVEVRSSTFDFRTPTFEVRSSNFELRRLEALLGSASFEHIHLEAPSALPQPPGFSPPSLVPFLLLFLPSRSAVCLPAPPSVCVIPLAPPPLARFPCRPPPSHLVFSNRYAQAQCV